MATTTTVKPLLPVQTPTPADIDIAQACTVKHISQIAEAALGLLPEEYELYGTSKAKVWWCVPIGPVGAGDRVLTCVCEE